MFSSSIPTCIRITLTVPLGDETVFGPGNFGPLGFLLFLNLYRARFSLRQTQHYAQFFATVTTWTGFDLFEMAKTMRILSARRLV